LAPDDQMRRGRDEFLSYDTRGGRRLNGTTRRPRVLTGVPAICPDYVLSRSAAGDDLIALMADEIEPTVVVRRYSNGTDLLMTSFET
jgi:hypothetical protein